jgi:hypothetical protein
MNRYSKQYIKPAIIKTLWLGLGIFVLIKFYSFLPGPVSIIIAALTYWYFWLILGDVMDIFKDGKKMGLKSFKKEIEDLQDSIRKLEIAEPKTDYTRREIENKRIKIEELKTYYEYKEVNSNY